MLLEMDSIAHQTDELAAAALLYAPYPGPSRADQDIAERVLSALLGDQGFVVITCGEGVAVEQLFNVLDGLQQAGLGTATMTAPVERLSLLDDAIRKAMTATRNPGDPLVVIIQHAEMLSVRTLLKLVTLSMLRAGGRPVLRFLLAGTPALWPSLRQAGVGALEHDPGAHIALTPGYDGIRTVPPPMFTLAVDDAAPWQAPARLAPVGLTRRTGVASRRDALTRARLAAAVLLSAGFAIAWMALVPPERGLRSSAASGVPAPGQPAAAPPPATGAPAGITVLRDPEPRREARRAPAAARPGRADVLPPLSAMRAPTPADLDGLRVTVRYGRGDGAAQAQARRLLARLREAGVPVDGPLAPGPGPASEHSTLSYYFAQDEQAARTMAQRLLPRSTQIRRLAVPDGALPPRPGGISISIGSHDDRSDQPSSGRQS